MEIISPSPGDITRTLYPLWFSRVEWDRYLSYYHEYTFLYIRGDKKAKTILTCTIQLTVYEYNVARGVERAFMALELNNILMTFVYQNRKSNFRLDLAFPIITF